MCASYLKFFAVLQVLGLTHPKGFSRSCELKSQLKFVNDKSILEVEENYDTEEGDKRICS